MLSTAKYGSILIDYSVFIVAPVLYNYIDCGGRLRKQLTNIK